MLLSLVLIFELKVQYQACAEVNFHEEIVEQQDMSKEPQQRQVSFQFEEEKEVDDKANHLEINSKKI